jgi:hypothetical protein
MEKLLPIYLWQQKRTASSENFFHLVLIFHLEVFAQALELVFGLCLLGFFING